MKGRTPTAAEKREIAAKILSRCVVSSSGCLVWPGANTRKGNGYGMVIYGGDRYLCHRAIWVRSNGDIPEGQLICHTCDNSMCCNIDHLFIGTQFDNMRDMYKKGRNVNGTRKGFDNPLARFSWVEIAYIRDNPDGILASEMARMFSVSDATIHRVIHRKRYV